MSKITSLGIGMILATALSHAMTALSARAGRLAGAGNGPRRERMSSRHCDWLTAGRWLSGRRSYCGSARSAVRRLNLPIL